MTVRTKISQTWLASQTGAIEWCAWSRIALAVLAATGEQLPEAGAEVGAGEHGVEHEPDEDEDQRERRRGASQPAGRAAGAAAEVASPAARARDAEHPDDAAGDGEVDERERA